MEQQDQSERPTPTDAADAPAVITQKEWKALSWYVYDTWRILSTFEKEVKPALEQITSGNFSLPSLLFGGARKK